MNITREFIEHLNMDEPHCFKNGREEQWFYTGLKYWFLGLIVMYISNIILLLIFRSGGANNENAVQKMIKLCPIAMGFYTCLIAPFVEEIVFRKRGGRFLVL